MAASESINQTRVMLWAPPRSLSTVFEKCMSFVDDIQIINEPYNSAAANNPETVKKLGEGGLHNFVDNFMSNIDKTEVAPNLQGVAWDDSQCTPAWVKSLLEGPFPGKKVVFSKDLILGIKDQFHMIPKGYRHTFLIRNPTKVLISRSKNMVKMMPPAEGQEINLLQMPKVMMEIYNPLLDLVEYVKKNEGETKPVIIDADDLQNHPESIVRQYCEVVGIPFKKSLLEWPAGDDCVKNTWLVSKIMLQGDQLIGWYKAAFESTKFVPAKPLPPEDEIPDDVKECAKIEELFYQKLYEMRIKP